MGNVTVTARVAGPFCLFVKIREDWRMAVEEEDEDESDYF
jgi:hypothetical protein